VSTGCRAFEDALVAQLDQSGPDAPIPPVEGHAASCDDCRALVSILGATRETVGSLAPPRPAVRLMRSLSVAPADFPVRREAAFVLDLLSPGALALPEPSDELMGHLRFLPTRVGDEVSHAAARPAWRRFVGDWRVTVALAYIATLVIVTLLGVDPMSAARGAASSLTSAGERAVEDAKQTALTRLESTARAVAEKPLTERLDYRIYKTLAEGKARATAYAQMAFEKVFGGGRVEATTVPPPATDGRSNKERERRADPRTEPDGKVLRS
jgi:hypothetical protein